MRQWLTITVVLLISVPRLSGADQTSVPLSCASVWHWSFHGGLVAQDTSGTTSATLALGPVHAIAGPDAQGRGVIFRDMGLSWTDPGFVVKAQLVTLTAGEFQLGAEICDFTMESAPSLSSQGTLAFVRKAKGVHTKSKKYYLVGSVYGGDLTSGSIKRLCDQAVSDRVSWLPDSESFLYVKLVAPETLPDAVFEASNLPRDSPLVADKVRVITMHALGSGKEKIIVIGAGPLVLSENEFIFYGAADTQFLDNHGLNHDVPTERLQVFDLRSMRSRPYDMPPELAYPIAVVNSVVIGVGKTPANLTTKKTKNNGLVGEKDMAALFACTGDKCEVLLPYFDRRTAISAGPCR